MNRRNFIKTAGAVATLPASTLVTIGCGAASQTTIASIITTIGGGLAAALTIAGQGSAAAQVLADANAAATAVKNWVPGTPGQDVIEALNLFVSNLNLLPLTDPTITALIQNAVTTVEGLLADFGVTAPVLAAAARNHSSIAAVAKARPLPVKYPSEATLKAALADFKATHNAIAKATPQYASAVIK